MKSKVLELINSAGENWREEFINRKIKIKEKENLAIFNYDIDCDFHDPVVCESRGIIIDVRELKVICWSFNKFFNIQETDYAAKIDWDHCRVEDKIDGSIIKLYWYGSEWHWATNSCIDAADATINNSKRTFMDVIKSAHNYSLIDYDNLNKDYTYTFELVSPETQVVIKYDFPRLYHIGTRNNCTGKELIENLHIDHPMKSLINSREEILKAAEHLNDNFNDVKFEGFVVVDQYWNRVKVKSPKYVELHRSFNNGYVSKEKIIKLLRNDYPDTEIEKICEMFPRYKTQIMYYKYRMMELEDTVARYINYVRGLYNEYSQNRKAVALVINKQKFSGFGFEALNNNKTAMEILDSLPLSKYMKLITDYEEVNIYE
jgi:hypothetical protein